VNIHTEHISLLHSDQSSGLEVNDLPQVFSSGYTYTGSALALDWVKSRIQDCSEHDQCKPRDDACLPDRVLSIGPRDSSEDANHYSDIQLYVSCNEKTPYITLSHMWGDHQPLKLLKNNISDFQKTITWASLPKTFQEAVLFARSLDIFYIWIDSLCIIQDSVEDWREQSGKMASIYENSYLTLAAAAATSSLGGCFRQPSTFLTGYVTDGIEKVSPEDHGAVMTLIRASTEKPVLFSHGHSEHRLPTRLEGEQLPLLTRGWVYQERLLSPRVLFFGDVDVLWECNEMPVCYCKAWTKYHIRHHSVQTVKSFHASALQLGKNDITPPLPESIGTRWNRIVEDYSTLNLSFMSDQLPAIAGVAKQVQRCFPGSQYVSGVWTKSIVQNLSWKINHAFESRKKISSSPTNLPSWTWLAAQTQVSYPPGKFLSSAKTCPIVLSTNFAQDGNDPFMDVTSGNIKLEGYLLEVKLRTITTVDQHNSRNQEVKQRRGMIVVGRKGFWYPYTLDATTKRLEWHSVLPLWVKNLPTTKRALLSEEHLTLDGDEDVDVQAPFMLSNFDVVTDVQQAARRLWCFAMGRYENDDRPDKDSFLLLELIDEGQCLYRRVGFDQCSVSGSIFQGMGEDRQVITLV
jgi:hypothetical protein